MTDIKQTISKAILKILIPMVRILLHHGISHQEFVELTKRAYVSVANTHFTIPQRKKTISRVAVLTGLNKKEVVRLLKINSSETLENMDPMNRATRVIGGWLQDADFQNKKGQPNDLGLVDETNGFKALVKRYSGDITSRAILDELLRVGAVEKIDKKTIRLKTKGYIPQNTNADMIGVMGISVADLLETINYNLVDRRFPRFQREVAYTDLPQDAVDEFKLLSFEKSLELLLELNKWLADKKRISKERLKDNQGKLVARTGLGIYFFENDSADENDPQITKNKNE
jgi:hypothetical protein